MTMNSVFLLLFAVALLLLIGNLWFFFRVLRPLRRLALRAAQIREGNFDSLEEDCGGIAEIGALRRAMAGMAGHVRRSQVQSSAYADRLADGQEVERKRIARELHDDTLQSLIVINQSIELAMNWTRSDPERAKQMLQLAREQALATVTNLRNLIGGLRPPALEELGLVAALEMEVAAMSDPPVSVVIEGVQRRLAEAQELALFRAAQEVLHNVHRHSRATKAEIVVGYGTDSVSLEITDDGCGFLPPKQIGDLAQTNHYGLIGLQERIQNLGGTVEIDSTPGTGTKVKIVLPTSDSTQPDHLVRDPVCSTLLEPQQAYGSAEYAGETFYFCCPVCQGAFQTDPLLYLVKPTHSDLPRRS